MPATAVMLLVMPWVQVLAPKVRARSEMEASWLIWLTPNSPLRVNTLALMPMRSRTLRLISATRTSSITCCTPPTCRRFTTFSFLPPAKGRARETAVSWATGPETSPLSTTESPAASTPIFSLGRIWWSFSFSRVTSASTVTMVVVKRLLPQMLRLVTPGARALT
ncbi:MAG: hypothetical protein A3K23_04290 [Desulfobacca sp. RBG_16_58_9]|nr:MAG: hypothetical protein A3K23_04290 [Desulfobacca sp. RBG_16_58_9]